MSFTIPELKIGNLLGGADTNPKEENWIWVEGYKGTDKDMKCKNDFQYEIGKRYDMPEDESIVACSSGFHFCMKLDDVFEYVCLGEGNRFFKVRALVRESDVKKYGTPDVNNLWYGTFASPKINKLAAKSIEIVRELTVDEIFESYIANNPEAANWSKEIKRLALEKSLSDAGQKYRTDVLIGMGYAEPLAKYIAKDNSGYDLAVALDDQPGISMDTKINAIFSHI